MNLRAAVGLAILLAVLLAAPALLGGYGLSVLILVLYFAYVGQAWNIMMGFAGQLSLGHALYAGLGGYIAAGLYFHYGIGPWLGVFAAIAVAVAAGSIVGYLGFRFSLAGVYFALLTIAFEILADARTHPSAEVRCALIGRLAEASGHSGMIGGQIIDMLADRSFGVEDVIDLQRRKTGQLFEFSCEAGPILGQADAETRARLKAYAEDMGVVFQITDDLLDVTSTAEKTGKAVGKDADMGKQTLVTLLGLEGARAEAEKRARRAVDALGPYAARSPELSALPFFLLNRDA